MIYGSIHAAGQTLPLTDPLKRVVDFLVATDFSTMPTGEYELDGRKIFYQVVESDTAPAAERRVEAHRKYVDVQFGLSGGEWIGFGHGVDKFPCTEEHPDRDLYFYDSVEHEGFLALDAGCFAVFFPQDFHRPACCGTQSPQKARKVIVKVSVELFQ